MLHAGIDTSGIALWLGHEHVETTQIYLHADLRLKERALALTKPPATKAGRFRPPDSLGAFLESLCSGNRVRVRWLGRHNPEVGVMDATALPGRADEDRGHRLLEAEVRVRDDQLHAGEAAGDQAAQEAGPDGASSAVKTSTPRISRLPLALTPVAIAVTTFTVRPFSRQR